MVILGIVFLIYNILLLPLFIIFLFFLAQRSFIKKEPFWRKLGWGLPREKGGTWIHAVSVGEAKASNPLVKEIKQREPEKPVYISTITVTGQDQAKRNDEVSATFFLPYDFPWLLLRVFLRIRPKRIIIMETEIWPNLILMARLFGVHIHLANGRLSKNSFSSYKRLRFWIGPLVNQFKSIGLQSKLDGERMEKLGVKRELFYFPGNLKLDGETLINMGYEGKSLKKRIGFSEQDPILIGGSTHPGEEEFLIATFSQLKNEEENWKLIIAPRHIQRTSEIKAMIGEKFPVIQKSEIDRQKKNVEIMIVDTMGELVDFYGIGDFIFIGGSFVPVGGHNPLEGLGKPLFIGKYRENCQEISDLLIQEGLLKEVKSTEELYNKIKEIRKKQRLKEDLKEKAEDFIKKHKGVAERIWDRISLGEKKGL